MRRSAWAALLALAFAGCYSDQTRQEASCELSAKRFAEAHADSTSDDVTAQRVELCMSAYGYELSPENCPPRFQMPRSEDLEADAEQGGMKRTDPRLRSIVARRIAVVVRQQELEAACYQPMSWTDRQVFDWEKWLGWVSD